MTKKIIAIHQPNYLPWLGYFYKIYLSDVFIFHDNVELTKKGYTRRTNIRKGVSDESTLLTVPLQKHSDFALIKNLLVTENQNWKEKHLNKLKSAYQNAPYFKRYIWVVERVFIKNLILSKLNIELIERIAEILHFKTEFHQSSKLPVDGKGSDYNLNLCKHFQATHYACGKGAKNYQNDKTFEDASINVLYNDFYSFLNHNKYKQHHPIFLNGLSILDSLFNIGIEGITELMQDYEKTSNTISY